MRENETVQVSPVLPWYWKIIILMDTWCSEARGYPEQFRFSAFFLLPRFSQCASNFSKRLWTVWRNFFRPVLVYAHHICRGHFEQPRFGVKFFLPRFGQCTSNLSRFQRRDCATLYSSANNISTLSPDFPLKQTHKTLIPEQTLWINNGRRENSYQKEVITESKENSNKWAYNELWDSMTIQYLLRVLRPLFLFQNSISLVFLFCFLSRFKCFVKFISWYPIFRKPIPGVLVRLGKVGAKESLKLKKKKYSLPSSFKSQVRGL